MEKPFSLVKVVDSIPKPVVTLGQVKDYMNRNDSVHDELLSKIIKSATFWIENKTRKMLTVKTIECLYAFDDEISTSLLWPYHPFVSLETAVGFVDHERERVAKLKRYKANFDCFYVDFKGPWVEVVYRAGYSETPPDLIQATLMMVNYLYDIRFEPVDRTPIDILLAPYCVRRV
jgi:hypothetical protein